jgi:hypothetical protein
VFGWGLGLFKLCDSDFGIIPVAEITIGTTCTAACFHIARTSFASSWYFFCFSVIVYYYYYLGTRNFWMCFNITRNTLGNLHLYKDTKMCPKIQYRNNANKRAEIEVFTYSEAYNHF